MLITARIAQQAKQCAEGLAVTGLCLGLGYTGVALSNGAGGVCLTIRQEIGRSCGILDYAGSLEGMHAADAVDLAMSANLAEAAIGIAAINALLNTDIGPTATDKNALEEMDVRAEDTVGMVGQFHPVVTRLREQVKQLHIFERKGILEEGVLPDWAEEIYLPQCDVVLITGAAFANKTIDHVLSLCKQAKEIVIMGPSTCMAPEILVNYGVTLLAGVSVTNPEQMLKTLAQGGGGRHISSYSRQLCRRVAPRRG